MRFGAIPVMPIAFLLLAAPYLTLANTGEEVLPSLSASVEIATVDVLLTKETKLTASDGSSLDAFGFSTAISRDTVVVGSWPRLHGGTDPGSAYVFARDGGIWSQQQKLQPIGIQTTDNFGSAVAIDGDTAVIGAPGSAPDPGAAYVFVRGEGGWNLQQKLTSPAAGQNDFGAFGMSVAVTGDTVLIGKSGEAYGRGAAYVFVRDGGTWSAQQRLAINDLAPGSQFGRRVALSEGTAVVGIAGPEEVYVFTRSDGTWIQRQRLTTGAPPHSATEGQSLSVDGNTIVVGALNTHNFAGSAFVFARDGEIWTLQQELTASDAGSFSYFGLSAAVKGDSVLVGAPNGRSGRGAAYVFLREGGAWSQFQELAASDVAFASGFGSAVALGKDTAVIGYPDMGAGAAYVYEPPCPSCTSPPQTSPFPITFCGGGDVKASNGTTLINLPAKDIVLSCALVELPGTSGIRINAHSIKVDGPGGGSITANGKSGIQLNAGASPAPCDLSATIDVESASIQAGNINGGLKVTACGNVVLNGASIRASAILSASSTAGKICSKGSAVGGNQVLLTASGPAASGAGDVALSGTAIQTVGSRQAIRLVSTNGSVLAGAPVGCPPNGFQTGNDGDMTVTASATADFTRACIQIGQNITVVAAGAGKSCSTDVIIGLEDSVVRNDFGKAGVIAMTACGGAGLISIADAILVDSGSSGGGDDPNAVASLNGGKKTDLSAPLCSVSSRCGAAVGQPVAADQADRAIHHVVGIPKCDT